MNRYVKFLIIGCIFATLLYAPSSSEEGREKTASQEAKEKEGRAWTEASRGWIESGTSFYPYSTGINVGIGTTSPGYKLDVNGSVRITGGIHDGAGFGTPGQVLVTNGSDAFWSSSIPGGSGDYIWNQFSTAQSPGNFWINGRGRIIHSAPTGNDTAFTARANDPGRRGIYGECFASDGAGVGVTGVGGYFGTAAWYAPSNGYIGGVLGTYWGEGVWGLSDATYYGYTGVLGEGRNGAAGVTGCANGLWIYYAGAGVGGFSTDVGTFGYGDATSLSFGVWGVSDATDGIGVYGQSAGASLYMPPSGQDAGLFASGQYYGLYGMAQRNIDYGIGVVGLGYNTSTLTYTNGAGVIGCGYVGVFGAKDQYTYGILGYTTTYANYFYHNEQTTTDQQSAIYAYRTRTSANDGTGYGVSSTNQAIQGYNYWGDVYTFGVSGHNFNDFTRCGGVLGADVWGSYWGSLGYKNSAGVTYGGYFTSTGTGGGKQGIGFGSYGDLLGGWIRGEEYGLYATGRRYALYLDGNAYTTGYLATLQETDNQVNALYALTGSSVNIFTCGRGKLVNGQASINFEKNFSQMVSEKDPITVIVTPIGEYNQIYISNVSKNGFSAYETRGQANNEFCWIAIGKRKGYEDVQVPEEIVESDFDDNMLEVAFDENNLHGKAKGIWYDGYRLRFGTMPAKPVKKPAESENIAKVAELQKLTNKLEHLKKEIKRLERNIKRSIMDEEKNQGLNRTK
uniref:Peptidase S74 domain-containing protein n=1 Tax=candidate division WOR-3 bacterium TaxID=2052148 RepID=A0A7C4THK8_UNCW3